LQEATRIAERCGNADAHLLHVIRDFGDAGEIAGELLSLQVRLARVPEELKKRVEAVLASKPVKLTAHVRAGSVVRSILQTAADIDADLIVLGTHKRTGVEKLVLGSVAERVLKEAQCPVLIAVPKDHAAANRTSSIEPPCPDCVSIRHATADHSHWCDRHSRSRLRPHVYEPSDRTQVGAAGI
jgi:nucleotide-binding universal stress UspA family protein